MATFSYLNQVQQLYISYFGRPVDTAGQLYWAQVIDAANGDVSGVVAGFSASAESQALFGNQTSTQKITAIYQNLFGRTAEQAGLNYWVPLLDAGQVTQAQAAWSIFQAAAGTDTAVLSDKLTAANAFTQNLDTTAEIAGYTGANASATARTYLAKFNGSYAVSNAATDAVTAVSAATGAPLGVLPALVFAVARDANGAVTFTNPGSAIAVTLTGSNYTYTSTGTVTGTGTLSGTPTSITLPAATTLTLDSSLATGLTFPGAGTVKLSDTGSMTAAALKTLEAAVTGLLDASGLAALTAATAADATLLLVTNYGTSGDKLYTAANIAVTLTDTTATGAVLKALDDETTGLLNATTVTSITAATTADAKQLLVTSNPAQVTHATNVTVALSDTTAAAADLTAIDASTTGLVTAASLTGITGTLAEVTPALVAVAAGTTLSAASLASVTLTNVVTAAGLDSVVFANNATINLANVTGNALTLVNATVGAGKTLTIDGSAQTGTNAMTINASAETDGTVIFKGGAGADTMTGGAGIDTYLYSAANRSTLAATDIITNYRTSGNDVITISDIVTVAGTSATVQDLSGSGTIALALAAAANTNTVSNGISVFLMGADAYIYIETTGAATSYVTGDTVIKLTGSAWTTATNIVGLGIDGV